MASQLDGPTPLEVNFTASPSGGTGAYIAWGWHFGDGGASVSQNPSHTYNTTGTYTSWVNVTDSNGTTAQSNKLTITVTAPAPTLSRVTVTPSTDTLQIGTSANFTVTPTCTGGSCPAGTTYAWTLNNSLGALNSSTGPVVKFTAGGSAGSVTLTAIGTLNGISKSNSASITISSTLSPSLASVSITPPTATIATGGTQSLTGSPSCTGGSCPAGTMYTWSMNNSLGTLNASTGSAVTFTAKTTAGMVTLSVTATLNGKTATGASTITISSTPPPTLSAVTLSPPTDTLQIGTSANFTATPACTGGSCPSGTTYSWSVENTLATVSPTPGASVKLTAGSSAGSVTLYVNATLNGVTKEGTATITISSTPVPSLASVTIAPTAPTVTTDGSQSFTATPTCNGGNCPAGTTYSWSLSQTTLGTLNGTTGSTTTFTAGSHTGTVTLTVTVTLNGKSANSSTTVTVKSKAPTTGFLGLSGNGGYILIGVIVAVVVAAVAALFLLRKKPRPSEHAKTEEKETTEKPSTEGASKPADGDAKPKG